MLVFRVNVNFRHSVKKALSCLTFFSFELEDKLLPVCCLTRLQGYDTNVSLRTRAGNFWCLDKNVNIFSGYGIINCLII